MIKREKRGKRHWMDGYWRMKTMKPILVEHMRKDVTFMLSYQLKYFY